MFSWTEPSPGSNMTTNYLLVWKNSSQSIWSFQWWLFDFLHFLQKGLESLQDQAPLAIPFFPGLCSSQRSRKPALKRLWKVQLQWHISWYGDMTSYLISYYCENWKYNTHFLQPRKVWFYWSNPIESEMFHVKVVIYMISHLMVNNAFWFVALPFINQGQILFFLKMQLILHIAQSNFREQNFLYIFCSFLIL